MIKLRDDTFARRGRQQPRHRYVSAAVFVLIFLSLALLVLSRLNHPYIETIRSAVTPVFAPVLAYLAAPLAPVRDLTGRLQTVWASQDDFNRLRAENQALKSWEWRAQDLQRQLDALSRIAKLAPAPDIPFVTARVVADSTGPFVRSVVIDVGRDRGVRPGHPVINADGLVGRVIEASPTAARVLLLNDINMQVPVVIGGDNARGIATGNNGATPTLKHLPRDAKFTNGAVVATSGRGGLFPRSLRVGVIEMVADQPMVKPFADLARLDFVSVLQYQSPVLSLADDPLTGSGRKGR